MRPRGSRGGSTDEERKAKKVLLRLAASTAIFEREPRKKDGTVVVTNEQIPTNLNNRQISDSSSCEGYSARTTSTQQTVRGTTYGNASTELSLKTFDFSLKKLSVAF